ncbi:MAG: thiamine-phosphate kinase [Leptolyngbyaceae cyanobacterium]
MDQPTVADIGELGLLERLQPFCDADLLGDDAAVLPASSEPQSTVITTDILVDGVHFSDRTTSAQDVGWRAIAANLSDLAAMGANPIGVTVGLSLPGTTSVNWIEQVYQGMNACLKTYGGTILGGDICRAPHRSLAITALGRVSPQHVIHRNQARPGHAIVVTGYHGASRAGLELLLHPERSQGLTQAEQTGFIQSHQRPSPRFDVVNHLQSIHPSRIHPSRTKSRFEVAGMDSSDGLANAVLHLCQASNVGARLLRSQLPIPPTLTAWIGEKTAVDWCLYGGEDFELVLCLPPAIARELIDQLGTGATIIGTITAEPDVLLVDRPNTASGTALTWESCFQHF